MDEVAKPEEKLGEINQTFTGKKVLESLVKPLTTQPKVQKEANPIVAMMASSLPPKAEDLLKISPAQYIEYKQQTGQARHASSSSGQTASSFTSTRADIATVNARRTASDDEIRKSDFYQIVRSRQLKGRVNLITNKGILGIEIECSKVPKTSENFLELC